MTEYNHEQYFAENIARLFAHGLSETEIADLLVDEFEKDDAIRDLLVLVRKAWYDNDTEEKVTPHLKHVGQLEVAWYGPEDAPDSVTVECARCGEVISNLWERG